MMKAIKTNYINVFILITIVSLFLSCKKEEDEGRLPNISFKTENGYTYSSISVGKNQTILMGINASKAEDKDVLKTLNVSSTFDGGTAITILQETLTGSQGDSYSKDIQITTRNQSGTETYTFTVTNRDGLSNKVSLTLTVN